MRKYIFAIFSLVFHIVVVFNAVSYYVLFHSDGAKYTPNIGGDAIVMILTIFGLVLCYWMFWFQGYNRAKDLNKKK